MSVKKTDLKKFFGFAAGEGEINKELLIKYKQWLMEQLRLKRIRIQRTDIQYLERSLERAEYLKMVEMARRDKKEQIAMIMETMCATGIRVSELRFFRVENIQRGIVKVWNKGKCRLVILPQLLKKKLLIYINKNCIRSGVIFRTRSGRAKDRSNIWREMKEAAERAGIDPQKAFPHNLRHLFARTFYRETKNLINLADILGHSSLEVTRIYASDGLNEWKRNGISGNMVIQFGVGRPQFIDNSGYV